MTRCTGLPKDVLFYAAAVLFTMTTFSCAAGFDSVDHYNISWDSPGKSSSDSMPLGNGDIGLNVWTEQNGDLLFYISKTDSWGDNSRLLKVGKVRIRVEPSPLATGDEFRQTLSPKEGRIHIQYGKPGRSAELTVWVDANNPVIHVSSESPKPVTLTVTNEPWRTERYELPTIECSDIYLDRSKPDEKHAPTIVEPDTILKDQHRRIGWLHHNTKSIGPELTMRIQGLSAYEMTDPILHRTFGAVATADNAKRLDDLTLTTTAAKSQRINVYVLTRHPSTPDQWTKQMDRLIDSVEKSPFAKRLQAHNKWWSDFWDRSWIYATPNSPQTTRAGSNAFVVTRGYALQRFVNACAGRGAYPIKFNGTIFTVDHKGDPDYRRWGPGYWWMNTRLPYISMCASGDFDLMQPLFEMYAGQVFELSKYRTQRYFNHSGAYYPECIYFWGAVFSESYGWTPAKDRTDKLQVSGWHKWEWVCGPELVWMMLDYYEHTLDEKFLTDKIIPVANEVMAFFENFYKTNNEGKLVMHPSQAVETWWKCTNPMPELAGLIATTDRLLNLPDNTTSKANRARWKTFAAKLPPLPTRKVNDTEMLAPAEIFENKGNSENPELYAVFPFRLVSLEKPNAQLGIEALNHRWNKGNSGWRQDDIFMAYLGLTEQAKNNLTARARSSHTGSRFPAFWGPNYDWVPDQPHGGILLKTFQAMLMQTDGRKIYLLGAWPKEWDVDFKLCAPYNTTVSGTVQNATLKSLAVTPPARRKDIVIIQPQ